MENGIGSGERAFPAPKPGASNPEQKINRVVLDNYELGSFKVKTRNIEIDAKKLPKIETASVIPNKKGLIETYIGSGIYQYASFRDDAYGTGREVIFNGDIEYRPAVSPTISN